MPADIAQPALPPNILRQLAVAPHRLLFFVGATNVLLAMLWWALWLAGARWSLGIVSQPAIPAGWLHAMLMQYQVLPSFIFGFLLTVFPRWMSQPEFTRRHYVPVGVGMLGGQALTLAGIAGGLSWLRLGALLTTAGWTIGLVILARRAWQDQGRTWHAVSCTFALGFGLLGLLLYDIFLWRLDGVGARMMFVSIKLGSIVVLLPIFFTVCHRMIPFFTANVVPGYRPVRPMWVLAATWGLLLAHVWLEMRHGYTWLWMVDLPLSVLSGWLLWRWWPRTGMPALLRVLFIGFAWLPLAFALYAAQSLWFAAYGDFVLGRAPAHALFIGCFGSLLVAMVTRVTQGHSGRPLVLGRVATFAFVIIQWVTLVRIFAEIMPDAMAWQAIAGLGWILAFLPWAMRSIWIYATPRIDGRPG